MSNYPDNVSQNDIDASYGTLSDDAEDRLAELEVQLAEARKAHGICSQAYICYGADQGFDAVLEALDTVIRNCRHSIANIDAWDENNSGRM